MNSQAEGKRYGKQPKVLYLAFITAMFERYGYYIIGLLLTLYLKNVYNYTDEAAFGTFALFTALGYLTPAIGGYLADHLIGIKRCLALGLFLEGIGYLLLAIPKDDPFIFHVALACIIIGAGVFKTAPTNLLGRSYEDDDPRIDSGFTLYYMGINIGSFGSSLIAGTIQKAYGWHVPFAFAAAGLFIGIFWFFALKRYAVEVGSKPGGMRFGPWKWAVTILGCAAAVALFAYLISDEQVANVSFYLGSAGVFAYLLYQMMVSPREEKIKIAVCLSLIFMAVVFFLLYFQLYTSMELFVERNVQRDYFGLTLPTVFFLGLNGAWIILLSPIYAMIYRALERRNRDLAITTKFPLGILIMAACFFLLYFAATHFGGPGHKISALWMVVAIMLYSAGELLTSALGVAMITRIAPTRMYGVMMGAWYLIAFALAAELSGVVARFASIPEELQGDVAASLAIYGSAFFKMGMIGIVTAVVGLAIGPSLKRAARI